MVQQDISSSKPTSTNVSISGMVDGHNIPPTDMQSSPISSMESNGGYPASPCGRTAADVQATLGSLSGVNGVSQDDLIAKLRSVVNQNLELKESLAQNNLALRQQLALVVRWSQQCQQQQQQQQQQLARASMQISALQHENSLHKGARDGQGRSGSNEETEVLRQQLVSVHQQVQQLQDDKDKLATLRAKLEADVTLLKCDLTTSRGDQERLQLERSHLMATNTELKQQLRQHHLAHQQQQNAGADSEARREREVNAELRRQAEEARAEGDALRADLSRSQQKVASLETHAAARTAVGADGGSSQDMRKLQEEAALLKEDVEVLEKTLNAERIKLSEERQSNSRAASELATLRSELQEARDTIHRNTNTDHYYQTKIKSINEQQDAVTAKLLSYEELLAAKNEELSKLKKESGQAKARLAEMQSEGETIAILRAQVEVYQGDFRAEREAREALASEREQLRDELRQLQARNTHLLDELQAAQHLPPRAPGSRAGSVEPVASLTPPPSLAAPRAEGGAAAHSALMDQLSQNLEPKENDKTKKESPQVVDESLFYCPKCNKSFAELRPLEAHVNRCLDED